MPTLTNQFEDHANYMYMSGNGSLNGLRKLFGNISGVSGDRNKRWQAPQHGTDPLLRICSGEIG